MPRLKRRPNHRAGQGNEDAAEEQKNEVEDATNAILAAEGEGAEEAAVTKTPRRRKRKSRPNGVTPSTTTGNNSQNENRKIRMAGMIFMCNTATKKDCFKYGVFGFPEKKKDSVALVKKGMKLFLYDVDKKHLYGVYEASSRGGLNLVSEAFQGSDRKFPAQVKFRIRKDCMPLAGSAFKEADKDSSNSGGRFNVELTAEQVCKLTHLFRSSGSDGLPQPTQPRHAQGAQREPAQDAHRGPSQNRYAHQGPPQDHYVTRPLPPPLPARDPVRSRGLGYSMESTSLYARECLPTELDYYRAQPSYLTASQIAATETRWRHLDTLHLQEASMLSQRPLPYDPLYRSAEYQRERSYYSSYGVSHGLGFLP